MHMGSSEMPSWPCRATPCCRTTPHRPPDLCMMSVHLPASLESSAQSASCLQKQYCLARATMLLLCLRVVFQGPSILLNDAPHVLSFHCILGRCCPPNSGSGITLLILPKQYCSDSPGGGRGASRRPQNFASVRQPYVARHTGSSRYRPFT